MKINYSLLFVFAIFSQLYSAEKVDPTPPAYSDPAVDFAAAASSSLSRELPASSMSAHLPLIHRPFRETFLDESRISNFPGYAKDMTHLAKAYLRGDGGVAKEPLTALAILAAVVDMQIDPRPASTRKFGKEPLVALLGILYDKQHKLNVPEKLEYLSLALRSGIDQELEELFPRSFFGCAVNNDIMKASVNERKYFPHVHTTAFVDVLSTGDALKIALASEAFGKKSDSVVVDPWRSLIAATLAVKIDPKCALAQNALGLYHSHCHSQIMPRSQERAREYYEKAHSLDSTNKAFRFNICISDAIIYGKLTPAIEEHFPHLSQEHKRIIKDKLFVDSQEESDSNSEYEGWLSE